MSYENKLSSGLPWEGYYYSAYGIAVKHGYKGTEAEWVKDLFGGKISAARSAAEAAAMRSGAISAAAAAREAAGDAEGYAQLARNFIGIPKTAMSAAAMTDTTAIYVYCGDEAGYNFGHWYYHGNGAWNDGGAYFAATQMVTDEYGSVYTSPEERAANLKEATETPVYTFKLGDYAPGHWYPSGGIATWDSRGGCTKNHPIRYDETMWVEIDPNRVSDYGYIYLGSVAGGTFNATTAIRIRNDAQTVTLRAYKGEGEYVAFGFYDEAGLLTDVPFTVKMKSPICRLIGMQTPAFGNTHLEEWPVDQRYTTVKRDKDGNEVGVQYNRGSHRIMFYKSRNIYTYGAKYVFADGLPIDCVFERYDPKTGKYTQIENCGFPVNSGVVAEKSYKTPYDEDSDWDDTTKCYVYIGDDKNVPATSGRPECKFIKNTWYYYGTDWVAGGSVTDDDLTEDIIVPDMSQPGTTVYPRLAKIPDDCGRMRLFVFGIQRPAGRNYLGNVILDVIQNICLYHDAERAPVPSPAIGRAIRNAKTLVELRYPAKTIRTRYYNFHPYPNLTPGSGAVGIPYGQTTIGRSGSYYSYLCSARSPYSIEQAHYLGTNAYWGQVCVTFLSQVFGFEHYQGTEWWLQNFGDRLKKLTKDTILNPGDVIVMTWHYTSLPDDKKDKEVVTVESWPSEPDTDKVYLYMGYEKGYTHKAKYWYGKVNVEDGEEEPNWHAAPANLYTHIRLVVGQIQDPKTGAFSGYLVAEESNIWTRYAVVNTLGGEGQWYMHLPSLTLENPIGDYRINSIDTVIPNIRQTYRYAVDKLYDPLSNPNFEIPPVQPRLGDMTFVHDESISGDAQGKSWSGNYAKPARPFCMEKAPKGGSYKWGKLTKLTGEGTATKIFSFAALEEYPVARFEPHDNYDLVYLDEVLAYWWSSSPQGDYQFSVSAAITEPTAGDGNWSKPCSFRWFTDPAFSVSGPSIEVRNPDGTVEEYQLARRVTINSLGSFSEVWAECYPVNGAVVDGEQLPYANYIMVHIPVPDDPENLPFTWEVPDEYSHVYRLTFIDNAYGSINMVVSKSKHDDRISYAGNAEGDPDSGDNDDPKEE